MTKWAKPGTWADAYTPRSRPVTIIYAGGPADGTRHVLPLARLPQVRYHADPAQRSARVVVLARYVRHDVPAAWTLTYRYTGLEERAGPVLAGNPDTPDWS